MVLELYSTGRLRTRTTFVALILIGQFFGGVGGGWAPGGANMSDRDKFSNFHILEALRVEHRLLFIEACTSLFL